ncbi:MAG: DUF262 domain-containing protein [Polyangiales bacterium]
MTLPYYGRMPNLVSIAALLDAVREGGLRIARLQRRFTWTDEQRVNLLDSIYHNYPIGTLTVWRTRDNLLACEEKVADIAVPDDEALRNAPVKEYVLDGLQRISTLYGALGPALLPDHVDRVHREAWEVYFDLDRETFSCATDLASAPASVRARQLPVSVILNTTRFLDALDVHRKGDKPERIAIAEKLLRQINTYQVPILPLITEKIDDAVKSFTRLNTAGTHLDMAAILHALSYRKGDAGGVPEIDLLHGFDRVREQVAGSWSPVRELGDEMLRHITFAELRVPIYASKDQTNERFVRELRAAPEVIDRVAEGVRCAVSFLRERCGVAGPRVLPYMFQLVLLARALRPRWPLSAAQSEAARRWFLATTMTHHFASQRRVQGTLKDLEALLDGAQREVLPEARPVVPMGRFLFGRARDKALALQLARRGPRVPGAPEDDAVAEATALLAELGEGALHELVPARSEDGRRIDQALVHDAGNIVLVRERHLPELRACLFGAAGTLFEKAPACDEALLRSHAIPAEALAALRAGDGEAFIRARGELLRGEERALVAELGLSYGGAGDERA